MPDQPKPNPPHDDPPPVVHYRAASPGTPKEHVMLRDCAVGFALGIVVSFLAWVMGWRLTMAPAYASAFAIGMLVVKAAGGGVLILFSRYKGLGIGLLISIPVGVLLWGMGGLIAFCSPK